MRIIVMIVIWSVWGLIYKMGNICPDCKSSINVQYLGGEEAYTCTVCDNHFYIKDRRERKIRNLNKSKVI